MGDPVKASCNCGQIHWGWTSPIYMDEDGIAHARRHCAPAFTSTQEATAAANARGEGFKADDGKPRWTLLPFEPLEDVVRVLTDGAKKYAPGNWMTVPNATERYLDAAFRHLAARGRGELLDPESNRPHLSHAICCCLFAAWFDGVEAARWLRERRPRGA